MSSKIILKGQNFLKCVGEGDLKISSSACLCLWWWALKCLDWKKGRPFWVINWGLASSAEDQALLFLTPWFEWQRTRKSNFIKANLLFRVALLSRIFVNHSCPGVINWEVLKSNVCNPIGTSQKSARKTAGGISSPGFWPSLLYHALCPLLSSQGRQKLPSTI